MKRFLNLSDFSREQILDLLALAQALQDKPEPRALAGKILGLVFLNPSLRTLASFQAGMARLGGSSFVITPGQGTWQLETRLNAIMKGAAAEHIREGIPVLASYCDALGVRAFAEGKNLGLDLSESLFAMIDQLCDKPLINLESAMSHPCQALADWRTMDELHLPKRAKFVLSWVYHPKALPLAVPAATVHMAAMRGMEVVVLRPDGFALPPQIMLAAQPPPPRRAARSPRPPTARPPSRARACCMRRSGARRRTTAIRKRTRGCAPIFRTGACASVGSQGHCRTPNSCIVCRCGAMSRLPMKFSTARAQWSSARLSIAWRCRWPFCTAC